MLESLLPDIRLSLRVFRRNPGFAAIAVVTLALGIGANAAIFSVVRAVLLRPLPWAERVAAGFVTANTFTVLGVAPLHGRAFTPAEDLPNGPRLAVLGYGLWSRRYAADTGVIGRTIQINGQPYEVTGVMPPGFVLPTDFQNPAPTELWLPLQMDPASTDHGSHGFYAAARLKPGATVQQAADELHGIARAMTSEGLYPVQMQFDTVVLSLTDEVVGPIRRGIWLLFGAVGVLLLIACANVANLLLARAEGRQREMAVRVALGASGARVVRQLLTESLLLTLMASAAGLVLAYGGVRLVAWWNPASVPRVAGVSVDLQVLLFTVLVAVVTSVVFGLAPALRAVRVDLTDSLKDGAQGASSGGARGRFRNALVVAEMALAVVLLVGAGLMIRSLWSLQRVELGFEPSRVLTMRLALPSAAYQSPEHVVEFYVRLMDRVRELPGVRTAGAVRALPLGSTIGDYGLRVEGYMPPPGTGAKGDWQIVTDGYLDAMGERLVSGRTITAADKTDTMPVALINEEMARRYWPGRDALGGRFTIGGGGPPRPAITVVGIVANVRHNGITDIAKEKYVPHTQWHKSAGNPIRGMTLVVESVQDPRALAAPLRQLIREMDPSLPVSDVRTMDDVVAATRSAPKFTAMLMGVFAALALALSAIGIYGVLSYVVSRRTREIGIRVAIGAGRAQVLRLILLNGLGLALIGVVLGLGAAAGLSRLMSSLLHGVTPADPATFITVGVSLTLVALLASLVPAWRAASLDPVRALKSE